MTIVSIFHWGFRLKSGTLGLAARGSALMGSDQQQQLANGHAASGDDGDGDGDHDDPPYIVFGYGSLIFRVRFNPFTTPLGYGP
jgi:hypothetical protein